MKPGLSVNGDLSEIVQNPFLTYFCPHSIHSKTSGDPAVRARLIKVSWEVPEGVAGISGESQDHFHSLLL